MAVLHGYRQTLLWASLGPAMLAPYAYNSVYLNVPSVHGRDGHDRVQMGRRERGDAFQRSAPSECSEGGAEGSPDLHRSEGDGADAVVAAFPIAARGEGLYDLRDVGADGRPGLHEHRYRFSRCDSSAGRATGRYGGGYDGRCTCSGSTEQWRPVYDYTGRSGRAHHSDGDQRPHRHYGVLVAGRDVPRSPALAAVADESGQKALAASRSALRHRQVRLGR